MVRDQVSFWHISELRTSPRMSDHRTEAAIMRADFPLSARPASRPLHTAWALYKLREDELVPLICPTSQMFSKDRSKHPCQRHRPTLHGVVFAILVGSENASALRPGSVACQQMFGAPRFSSFSTQSAQSGL
jgi:hypothetical protein